MSKRLEQYLTGAVIAVLLGAMYVALKSRGKRRVERSERSEQETPAGEPVADEWGKESFPASDPPQSW